MQKRGDWCRNWISAKFECCKGVKVLKGIKALTQRKNQSLQKSFKLPMHLFTKMRKQWKKRVARSSTLNLNLSHLSAMTAESNTSICYMSYPSLIKTRFGNKSLVSDKKWVIRDNSAMWHDWSLQKNHPCIIFHLLQI